MTSKDDIIRMAREAGAYRLVEANKGSMICISQAQLERFAALVAAAEREACAELLDANAMACHSPIYRSLLQSNADAIRARGQA